ncbi:Nin1 binding protein [Tulasnella sp. 418]|nr:Nin1 binding protein [Tulasnella sp. 418]
MANAMPSSSLPRIESLVLDAGPLLELKPLRGLAKRYFTTPHVVAELKDRRAREHFEQLGLMEGVEVVVRQPSVLSLAHVTAFSKKTGDYSVLSHPDLCVLALAHELSEQAKQLEKSADSQAKSTEHDKDATPTEITGHNDGSSPISPDTLAQDLQGVSLSEPKSPASDEGDNPPATDEDEAELPETVREPLWDPSKDNQSSVAQGNSNEPLYDDPSSEDDGEGEWITPTNVAKHKAKELNGTSIFDKDAENKVLQVACMTADFAMQNVLLQLGLNLVGAEGKRIATIKTWVLRCHACFKICKDSSKKFCPSCGNPTLLRTSVTVHAAHPDAPDQQPTMQVHLKKNFQYRNRGQVYSLPPPKMNRAKGGGEASIILREDQVEWQRGMKSEAVRQRKDEKRMKRALEEQEKTGGSLWNDPDWVPELLVDRSGSRLPAIGHGRRNPNEVRRKNR